MSELPLDRVYHWERTRPEKTFLSQPVKGVVRDWTWAQSLDEARRVAQHLIDKQWPAGSHIVIFSKNCSWWIMAELAIWMSGHVTVPIYPSLTSQSARQLFEHCDPVACFVGDLDAPDLAKDAIPANLDTIRFPNAIGSEHTAWEQIVATTEPLATNPLRKADDIATIIYTSGTTGSPKGAIHRFAAFPVMAKAVAQVAGEGSQRGLSYLPLAHIAERGLTETMAIYYAWHLFFCEGVSSFLIDLKRARPTVFFSVPRLYTKFQQKVFDTIFRERLALLQKVPILGTLIGKYILWKMGFAHVRFAASGSAPLPLDLLHWFRALGFPLTEGYGTTETGITHTAPNGQSRPGYVGKTAPGVEAKLSASGEVLLRSPMNMLGYYKNPEDTRQAFTEDGFIHTGDLGELSADGWLKITGRIKEQFKTTKGKYVSPSKIEGLLSTHPAVEQCLVFGADQAAPCGVVVLTQAAFKQASTEAGRKALTEAFEELLVSINRQVETHEHLSFLAIVTSPWTIESGFITPTMKLKRMPLEAFYAPLIQSSREQYSHVVWLLT